MKLKIIYTCFTCINNNKHNSDRPAFTPYQTIYDTFSDAVYHLARSDVYSDYPHYMEAKIVEEE